MKYVSAFSGRENNVGLVVDFGVDLSFLIFTVYITFALLVYHFNYRK
jgi:hypothetical protein